MRYPESLVDEILDACEDEGGKPILMSAATISCDGTYEGAKMKVTVSYQDTVDCVASNCEEEDFEDFELESLITFLEQGLSRDPHGLQDVDCWVEEDEDDGLSGGAIAGIVIGSVFGAALLLAFAYCLLCRETDEEPKFETSATAVLA
jgi:hypothetical protein